MAPVDPATLLANYDTLVAKVDDLCQRIEREFADKLACRAGCAGCCLHLSLSWVEGVALATALERLPPPLIDKLRCQAREAVADGPCPLLIDDRCALYEARPLICRTHGLPVLVSRDGERAVDFCPLNFQGVNSLPGRAVLDLETLNTLLESVNRLFAAEYFAAPPVQERITIAEAILLDLHKPGDAP